MFQDRHAVVLSVSNRAFAGVYEDTTGPQIVAALQAWGFGRVEGVVVPDGEAVQNALYDAIGGGADLIITTGGTGLTPTDRTPEMTLSVIEREVPGIAEAIRAYGVSKGIAAAALSRGVAGLTGSTLIINTPGSPGGVKDALAVIQPILEHALDQIRGGDHARPPDDEASS